MTLKELRKKYNISQLEAASASNLPLRTYVRYEDESYGDALKRQAIIDRINDKFEITETKGILTVSQIKEKVLSVINKKKYEGEIDLVYLFGSYAKGYATEKSDVDLYASTTAEGFHFYGLVEDIRQILHKKVDFVTFHKDHVNLDLIHEIMKDGIKIYAKHEE